MVIEHTVLRNGFEPRVAIPNGPDGGEEFQPFESWREIARALTTPNREQP